MRQVDVRVREVGLRDGLQIHPTFMPTEQKLAWIAAESAAGVAEIEVTSYVPPKLIPQFADAEAVTRGALEIPGFLVAALSLAKVVSINISSNTIPSPFKVRSIKS